MQHDRRNILYSITSLASAALWSADAAAQPASAVEEMLAVNRAFDEALSRLDIAALDALSLQESHVIAIHPNARQITIGWEEVRKSWLGVAERFSELSVKLDNPTAVVRDNVGWVTGTEVVNAKRKTGEVVNYTALTTNIYEKRNGRWLMSAHLTARVPS